MYIVRSIFKKINWYTAIVCEEFLSSSHSLSTHVNMNIPINSLFFFFFFSTKKTTLKVFKSPKESKNRFQYGRKREIKIIH